MVTTPFGFRDFVTNAILLSMKSPSAALFAMTACLAHGAQPLTPGETMQYGPILSCSVEAPAPAGSPAPKAGAADASPEELARLVAGKGIVIRLGDGANVCFDTDTLRLAAGWTDGFLKLAKTNIGSYKGFGSGAAEIEGRMIFRTSNGPGWSTNPTFTDPRKDGAGPLPRDVAKYRGFYLHENEVVLAYTVRRVEVLEGVEWDGVGAEGQRFIHRTFTLDGNSADPLFLTVADQLPASCAVDRIGEAIVLNDDPNDPSSRLGLVLEGPDGAQWELGERGRISARLPPFATASFLKVSYWRGNADEVPKFKRALDALPGVANMHFELGLGAPLWPQVFTMHGTIAESREPYVVDTIPIPEDNPWKSWMRLSAIDFFPDGRAAVATLNGDVWLVSGLDATLEKVVWKRFAAGLHEPLGLKIVGGKIYVIGRGQITRLHDLDGDDEADFYENFNSDRTIQQSYHTFVFDLQTDRAGNFYYVTGGHALSHDRPWYASLFKVSADGKTTEPVATGFRAPNGLTIAPDDTIYVSDNQGQWIPATKINRVRPGGFYGHVADPRLDPDAPAPPSFDPPLCYVPMSLDNSAGGGAWCESDRWGPWRGHLLQTSFGACALFAVLEERIGNVTQGGVVKLPLNFDSGIIRARFAPHDGQLYVVGLRGWQTKAAKEGCLQRVRFTGKPMHLPVGLRVEKEGIAVIFAEPLERGSATDPQNFAIEQWNYRWWSTYGSPDLSLARPGAQGRDPLEVTSAQLSEDGKTVRLIVPGIEPVMQMSIKFRITAADGTPIQTEIASTINTLPR